MASIKACIVPPVLAIYRFVCALFTFVYWLLVERNSQITRLAFQLEQLNKEEHQLDCELNLLNRQYQLKSGQILKRKTSIDSKRTEIVRQLTNVGCGGGGAVDGLTKTLLDSTSSSPISSATASSTNANSYSCNTNFPKTLKVVQTRKSVTSMVDISRNNKLANQAGRVNSKDASNKLWPSTPTKSGTGTSSSSFLSASKNFLFPSISKSINREASLTPEPCSLKAKPPATLLAPSIRAIQNQLNPAISSDSFAPSRTLFGGINRMINTAYSTTDLVPTRPVASPPPTAAVSNKAQPAMTLVPTTQRMNDYFELVLQNTIQEFRQSNPSKQFRLTMTELYGDPEWRPLINDLKRQYKIFCYL